MIDRPISDPIRMVRGIQCSTIQVNQEIGDFVCLGVQAYHSQCRLNTGARLQQWFQGGHATCFTANDQYVAIASIRDVNSVFPRTGGLVKTRDYLKLSRNSSCIPGAATVEGSKEFLGTVSETYLLRRGCRRIVDARVAGFGVAPLISGLFLVSIKAFQLPCTIICVMMESLLPFVHPFWKFDPFPRPIRL
jgi:hypothetical protein